jgi:hypothetical protein
MRIAWKAGGN